MLLKFHVSFKRFFGSNYFFYNMHFVSRALSFRGLPVYSTEEGLYFNMAATMWKKSLPNINNHGLITTNPKLLSFRYILGRYAGLSTATKPYAFHPKTRTLESDIQALSLTKTILKPDLPAPLQSNVLKDSLRDKMMDRFRQCLVQTRLFNYEEERSTKTTCALPLMMNMMKIVWSEANRWAIRVILS